MLVIYIDRPTNRLGYTINFIFKDLLATDFMVTTSKETFIAEKGAKISYCEKAVYDEIHISSSPLLFKTEIADTEADFLEKNGTPYLFNTYSKDDALGFDIFAATFYLISRYEEYLPSISDKHSRFRAEDSLAYQKNFLELPIVDIWAEELKNKIKEKYPDTIFREKKFSFLNTIDVDMAYYYREKGLYRGSGGFVRDILHKDFSSCKERLLVNFFNKHDPYDCFSYLQTMIMKYGLETIVFYLMSMSSDYDKNISPYNTRFQLLIKEMNDCTLTGIHPSYYITEQPERLAGQIKLLKDITHGDITDSRFHFLRFRLPLSYRNLIDNEITDDYSMGYPDVAGFRAGTCTPFQFYDLERDCETKLKVHPFAFMDVALKNGMQLSPNESIKKIKELADRVMEVNGEFISIWHNESLSDYKEWKGWREVYEHELEHLTNKTKKQ